MTRGVRPSPWHAVASRPSMAAPASKRGTRNAERGTDMSGSILGAGLVARRPHGVFRVPRSAFRILLLAQRQQVRKEPICTGDARGELPEEAQSGVHIGAL